MKKRVLICTAVAVLAPAAAPATSAAAPPVGLMMTEKEEDSDYGWIGLLGLAGLVGLLGRRRANGDTTTTRTDEET